VPWKKFQSFSVTFAGAEAMRLAGLATLATFSTLLIAFANWLPFHATFQAIEAPPDTNERTSEMIVMGSFSNFSKNSSLEV